MKNKKFPLSPVFPGLLTGAIVVLFLSGKIIKYPQGTREGGIIAGAGVAIILLVSFLIIALAKYIKKKKTSSNVPLDFQEK